MQELIGISDNSIKLTPLDEQIEEGSTYFHVESISKLDPELLVLFINSPRDFFESYFDFPVVIEPSKIVREDGDTTLFTTAGIQFIENMNNIGQKVNSDRVIVFQPSIRTQFVDRNVDGYLTAFHNIALIVPFSNQLDFFSNVRKLIQLPLTLGVSAEKILIKHRKVPDKWGDKEFTKDEITVYIDGVEVGECSILHGYQTLDGEETDIIDLGIGYERLTSVISGNESMINHIPIDNSVDESLQVFLFDPIRTTVFLAAQGISPSNKSHGYRIRKFSKIFVSRAMGLSVNIDLRGLVEAFYNDLERFGYSSPLDKEETYAVISKEHERNLNREVLELLKMHYYVEVYIDINQSTEDFMQQLKHSISSEQINLLEEQIWRIKV